MRLAGELQDVAPDRIVPLSAVVAGTVGRPVDADLTLFKAMGIGLADLALGDEVLRRAVAHGRGRPFPHPERLDPRLTPLGLTALEPTVLDLAASTRQELHVADPRFVDVSGMPVPGEPEYWEPIIFRRAEIEAETARLADLPAPDGGRRHALLVHPRAVEPGPRARARHPGDAGRAPARRADPSASPERRPRSASASVAAAGS